MTDTTVGADESQLAGVWPFPTERPERISTRGTDSAEHSMAKKGEDKFFGYSAQTVIGTLLTLLLGVVVYLFIDLKQVVISNTDSIDQTREQMIQGFGDVNRNLAILIERTGGTP